MTTVVVLADVPDEAALVTSELLSASEAATLYRATLADVCEMLQHGEADVLVNYPSPDWTDVDNPEDVLRELLGNELAAPEALRYEVQVGETHAARVGNALTHLLETEGEQTVAVVEPTAALLRRDHVGTVAMKLRTSDVVLGPSPGGGLYFAGFGEPIDFTDVFAPPAVETVTARAIDAGLSVEYLPVLPRLDRPADLATAVSLIRARRAAGRIVPPRTTALIERWGLSVDGDGLSRTPVESSDSS